MFIHDSFTTRLAGSASLHIRSVIYVFLTLIVQAKVLILKPRRALSLRLVPTILATLLLWVCILRHLQRVILKWDFSFVFSPFFLTKVVSSLWSQGTWVWLADHDLDLQGEEMITAYSGRGILSESQGPVWMIGTACGLTWALFFNMFSNLSTAAEHHVIYQYNLVRAKNHYMGLIQTESVCVSVIARLTIYLPGNGII